jgi:hypothetical protein
MMIVVFCDVLVLDFSMFDKISKAKSRCPHLDMSLVNKDQNTAPGGTYDLSLPVAL